MTNWIPINNKWSFKRCGYEWGMRTEKRTVYSPEAEKLFRLLLKNEPDMSEKEAKELIKKALCKLVDEWQVK